MAAASVSVQRAAIRYCSPALSWPSSNASSAASCFCRASADRPTRTAVAAAARAQLSTAATFAST
eukprot:3325019-Prymnesium_polylepis.1